MRRILFLSIAILIGLAPVVLAETVVRFTDADVQPGESFIIEIEIENDQILGGFNIPFRWSTTDLIFDSVTFVRERFHGASILGVRNVDVAERIAGVVFFSHPHSDSEQAWIPVGEGPVATAHFGARPTAPDQVAFVDSAYHFRDGLLEARVDLSSYTGSAIYPLVVPGVVRIGSPPSASMVAIPSQLTARGESVAAEPVRRNLEIRSEGTIQFDWTATWGSDWLSMSPSIGKTPALPTVSFDAFFLAPGQYQDTIVITSPLALNSPIQIPVVFAVDTASTRPPAGFGFTLLQNRPSPFVASVDPETEIPFLIEEATDISIELYNVLGNRVRELASGIYPIGDFSVTWDGRDASGDAVASGVYLCRMSTSRGTQSRAIVLIK